MKEVSEGSSPDPDGEDEWYETRVTIVFERCGVRRTKTKKEPSNTRNTSVLGVG